MDVKSLCISIWRLHFKLINMKLKNKLLLRLFGIKPKSNKSDLPKKLNKVSLKSTEDFNNWSSQLFINNHKN